MTIKINEQDIASYDGGDPLSVAMKRITKKTWRLELSRDGHALENGIISNDEAAYELDDASTIALIQYNRTSIMFPRLVQLTKKEIKND